MSELDDDDFDQDENDSGELIGWQCEACGHTQGHPGLGGRCDVCECFLTEWYD